MMEERERERRRRRGKKKQQTIVKLMMMEVDGSSSSSSNRQGGAYPYKLAGKRETSFPPPDTGTVSADEILLCSLLTCFASPVLQLRYFTTAE